MKALAIWAGILVMAVLNGTLREFFLVPKLGTAPGFFLSGVLLSLLIVLLTYLSLPWIDARRITELASIGLGWLCLTLLFEFSFGLLQGKSWQVILEAYTFRDGNIWPLVLFVVATAPYLAAKLRGLI
tara:strand:+ start:2689 stop:3072 length:384 start_codon:yes stop_codon:yes gene_type:complete